MRRAVSISKYEKVMVKEHTREAVKVNGAKEGEKFNSMLRKLGEVFINHLQCAFENILHDRGHLIFHESLHLSQYGFNAFSYSYVEGEEGRAH